MPSLDKQLPPEPPLGDDNLPSYTGPAPGSSLPFFRTQFSCVTLNGYDVVRFINFFPEDMSVMRHTIQAVWHRGIQEERPYGQSHEFHLRGSPWAYHADGDDGARLLLLRMLEALYNRGWVLQAAVDLSMKDADKDSLVFRHQNPSPPECHWLGVSFDAYNKLKIVGHPGADLANALVQTFDRAVAEHELSSNGLEIRFHGLPWLPSGMAAVNSRIMLLGMLQTLETFGYTVYSSIDMVAGRDGAETDVMIVHKQRDWAPGMPVWHR